MTWRSSCEYTPTHADGSTYVLPDSCYCGTALFINCVRSIIRYILSLFRLTDEAALLFPSSFYPDFAFLFCLMLSLFTCAAFVIGHSVVQLNTGLSDSNINNNNNEHHQNHHGTCRTTMTNKNETKRQLPGHTKCSVMFRDVRGSKIRDVKSPFSQHINRDTCAHTPTCRGCGRCRALCV